MIGIATSILISGGVRAIKATWTATTVSHDGGTGSEDYVTVVESSRLSPPNGVAQPGQFRSMYRWHLPDDRLAEGAGQISRSPGPFSGNTGRRSRTFWYELRRRHARFPAWPLGR